MNENIRFYLANSKMFEFLETNRKAFYAGAFCIVFIIGLIAFGFPTNTTTKSICLSALFSACAFLLISYRYFLKEQEWLSFQVKKDLYSSNVFPVKINFGGFVALFNLENNIGYLIITLCLWILIAFWTNPLFSVLNKFSLDTFALRDTSRTFLYTLWQVDSAVVTIIFIVIPLIFELFRSKGRIESELANIEKLTSYKPLMTLNFLILIPLGIIPLLISGNEVSGNLVSLLYAASIAFFVFSVITTLHVLLCFVYLNRPSNLLTSLIGTIRSELPKAIKNELTSLVYRNILFQLGEKNGFMGFGSDMRENYYPITANTKGTKIVTDINVAKIITINSELKSAFPGWKDVLIIVKGVGHRVSETDKIIARVPSDIKAKAYEESILSCFRFGNYTESSDTAGDLFKALRDAAVEAIRFGSTLNLNKALQTFLEISSSITTTFKFYGLNYDFKSSRQLFDGPRTAYLFPMYFREVIEDAFKAGDTEMLKSILYFPRQLMEKAVEDSDHLFFKVGLELYQYSMGCCVRFSTKDRPISAQTILLHVREFVDFNLTKKYIIGLLETNKTYIIEGYIKEILVTFNSFLKSSLFYPDVKAFKQTHQTFQELFKYSLREQNENADSLKWHLKHAQTDFDKAELQKKIKIAEGLEYLDMILKNEQKIIILGTGAYINKLFVDKKVDLDTATSHVALLVPHLGSLDEFTKLFLAADKNNVPIFYGWDFWDDEDDLTTVETRFSSDEWLYRFYCLFGLKMFDTARDADKVALPLETDKSYFSSSGLDYVANKVASTCNEIKSSKDLYGWYLSSDDLSKLEGFVAYHKRGVEEYKKREEIKLINAPIDDLKVSKFKDSFIKAWDDNTTLRKVFKEYNAFIDETSKDWDGKDNNGLGYNKLERKDLFIAEPDSDFSSFGEHYGSSLGSSEDDYITKQIIETLPVIEMGEEGLENKLVATIDTLKSRDYSPSVILVGGWKAHEGILSSTKFASKWALDTPYKNSATFMGTFDGINVFETLDRPNKSQIVVLDLNKVGSFKQLPTSTPGAHFSFSIELFSREKFDDLVTKHPEVLVDKDTRNNKDREATFKEYQKLVHLRIFERLLFVAKDELAGVVTDLGKDE